MSRKIKLPPAHEYFCIQALQIGWSVCIDKHGNIKARYTCRGSHISIFISSSKSAQLKDYEVLVTYASGPANTSGPLATFEVTRDIVYKNSTAKGRLFCT